LNNQLLRISFIFGDGTEVTCTRKAGFGTAFDAAQMLHNADMQLESLRVAYVDELLKKETKAKS